MRRLIFFVSIFAIGQSSLAADGFRLRWMNQGAGEEFYDSKDHPGAVFVVEAYFQACGDCNENAANVNSLAAQYAGDPRVQVLDVSKDCRDSDYRSWISRQNPNHPVLNDCDLQLLGPQNISWYPTTIIFDCNMNVIYRHEDFWTPSDIVTINQAIDKQLSSSCR